MSRKQPFNVSQDASHHATWVKQVGESRGGMIEAAEEEALPERFLATQHAHRAAVIIHDRETGRATTVALCNYYAARKLLNDLYGAPKPTAVQRLEALGLPLVVERDGYKAIGGISLFHDDYLCYRIEIDGVDGGEVGIARIDVRHKATNFVVLDQEGTVRPSTSLEDALSVVEEEILPRFSSSGPRF